MIFFIWQFLYLYLALQVASFITLAHAELSLAELTFSPTTIGIVSFSILIMLVLCHIPAIREYM